MTLKVLLMGPDLQQFSGGIQTHMRIFLEAYQHDPEIALTHFAVTEGKHDQEGVAAKAKRLVAKLSRFRRAMKSVDVIHVNCTFDAKSMVRDCLLLATGVGLRKPTVFQFHGGSPEIQARAGKRGLILFLLKRFSGKGQRLFLSLRQKEEFSQFFGLDSEVVPNYYDFSQSVPSQDRTADVPCHFIYLGRLHQSKGVDACIDVAEQLLSEGKDLRLSLYGGGPAFERTKARVASMNRPEVYFGGVINGQDKDVALSKADVMLLPTRHKEGFPYAILEALHHRLALITTAEGALREVVQSDKNGVLLENTEQATLYEAMQRYAAQPSLSHAHGEQGFLMAKAQYDVTLLRQRFDQIYRQALNTV